MEKYIAFTIEGNDEIMIAMMSVYPFESFEEKENQTIAYISEAQCTEEVVSEVNEILKSFGFGHTTDVIEPQNWNAIWESEFKPVVVRDFCVVRADFHDPNKEVLHDIIINPKMAFGTGHHETTYMMMDTMSQLEFQGKTVFDFGCGTGILAILASKLGADHIDAIDIENESYLNTKENMAINGTDNIKVKCSDLESFESKTYDIILANINRHILLNSSKSLYQKLNVGGHLLLSGILDSDEDVVSQNFMDTGLALVTVHSKGYWKCLHFKK